jgi:hypothetical protein
MYVKNRPIGEKWANLVTLVSGGPALGAEQI